MTINEDSPATVEHGTNVTRHMGTAALTRHYIMRAIQDVIKPAIKTFLETCHTNPRIAAMVATPALLAFLLVLAILIISALILTTWAILTITMGIFFVIVTGVVSLLFKLLVVVLATIPLAAIAIGLLVGANAATQSIIRRMPQNRVGLAITQTIKDKDWKPVVEFLTNLGKNLGPVSVAVYEGLLILKVALYDCFMAFKRGMEDVHNARVESLRRDPPGDSTAEMTGEAYQENTQSVFHHIQLHDSESESTGSTEGLKRRSPFSQTFNSEEDFAGAYIVE